MLLPSAMFCNNSQCEVDNCIKSSINRGGDEIYSTEEQEIQVPTHWSAEVPQVNWWRSGGTSALILYHSIVVVYLPLTPKIIDQLNEVVIKHASYIFFSKRWSTGGPSWEFFFVNITLIISKKIRRVLIKKLNRYSVVVSEIQTKVFQTDPSYRKLTQEEVAFVQLKYMSSNILQPHWQVFYQKNSGR